MPYRLRVLSVVLVLGAVLVPAASAAPRSVHSVQATATFAHQDSECLRTFVQIAAIRDTVREPGKEPVTSGRLLLSVEKQDTCSGTTPMVVFNGQGSAILREGDLEVVPFLESVTLHPVLVEIYDWVGDQPFSFSISGQWIGQGGLTDSHGAPVGNPDGPGVLDIQNNRFRAASAVVETTGVEPSVVPIGTLMWANLASVHWTLMR